jgi:tellurite resistance protein TerC
MDALLHALPGGVLVWGAFVTLILTLLALDLGVFHRRAHTPSMKESLGWSAVWITLGLSFTFVVHGLYERDWMDVVGSGADMDGRTAALAYLTGYVLEKSLSLDNIFVIAVIFSHFRVPLAYQHRVLFWGVLGALVFRGIMIGAGTALVASFSWMIYVLGGLLLVSAFRMLAIPHDELEPERNVFVRLVRRIHPVSQGFDGDRFLTRVDGRRAVTPLLLVLVLVESTDLMFAVDSIPAILAVTDQPFLVYTSNVFAILGLRSLYFALAPSLQYFRYLNVSLVLVLAFVGVKMILSHHYPIPLPLSLAIVAGIVFVGIVASLVRRALDAPSDEGMERTAASVSPRRPPGRGGPPK